MRAGGDDGLSSIRGAGLLVVEDNEINRQVAREILEGAGFRVALAENGQEAVEAVGEAEYHAVLMDVQMPVLDGYAATRAIRQDPRFRDLPIIAMTANAMAGDREKALAAGMNDHVAKPIDPDLLFASLARWIKPGAVGSPPPKRPEIADRSALTDTSALPESIPGIDLRDGLNRVAGNRQLYRKLLVKLREGYSDAKKEIDAQLKAGRVEEAERLAHSIKGVAGNVGARSLQSAAAGLEAAIRSSRSEAVPGRLETLGRELSALAGALEVLGPDEPGRAAPAQAQSPAGPEELAVALEEMLPHLKANKPKPSKEALARAARLVWPSELSIDFAELSQLVNKYRFKEASAKAELLLADLKG